MKRSIPFAIAFAGLILALAAPRAAQAIEFESSVPDQTFTVGSTVNLTLPRIVEGSGLSCTHADSDYSLSPSLPAGLSFNSNRDSRLISGTPTTATAQTQYTYSVSDTNCYETTSQTFNITVLAAPDITLSVSSVSVTEGSTGTYTVRLKSAPTGNVTVTVSSGDTNAVTASPTSLTFTTTDYSTTQTVTLTGVQDTDGADEAVTITHTASGGGITGKTATLTANVSDDDKGLTFSTTSLDLTEGGGAKTYTVALAAAPSGNVRVAMAPSTTPSASYDRSPFSLTFTTQNWSTPQTVTLTPRNPDGNPWNEPNQITHTASGGGYGSGVVTGKVSTFVFDAQQAGLVISPGSLSLTEGGSAGTFTLKLGGATSPNYPEAGTVTVALSSGDTGAATVNPASLSFNGSTWNTAQTVTVTPVADTDANNESVTITASASGSGFDRVTKTVTTTITDNDTGLAAGNVKETTATITLSGHTAAWWYKRTAPAGDTTCHSVAANTASVNLSGLTGGTAYTYKAYSNNTCTTEITSDSTDADFSTVGLTATSVTGTTATLTLSNWTAAWWHNKTSGPGSASCTSVAANTTTASLSSLTAASNYTWTVYSASGCASANKIADVAFTTAVSGAGLTLSATTVALTEGGAAGTYTVRLAAQPAGDVTVTVSSGDAGAVTASPATLTFTRTGTKIWSTAQTVTLTPVDDTDTTDESVTITHTAAGGGYNGRSATLTATVSDEAILAVSGINDTGATLTISNHGGVAWWYKRTVPVSPTDSCRSVDAGTTTQSPTWPRTSEPGWFGGDTGITIKAYSAANCSSTDEIASISFGVIGLDPRQAFYEEGETGSVRVTLPAVLRGSANLTVTLTNPDTTAVTLGQTTCTFVPLGARTCTVSVTTLQDADYDQEEVTISGTASGGGGLYSGSIATSKALIRDDDGIVPSMSTVRLTEGGGTGSFTVKLAGAPTDDVTMTVTSLDTGAVTRSPASLTFTTDNWNTPRTVTLTPVDDGDSNHESVTIRLSASGGGYGARTSVTAKVSDDEGPQLTASAVTPTTATLTLTNHTPNTWWYKKTLPTPAGNCTSGPSDKSLELSNLTASTNYTYKAYNASSCADANEIAEQSFSTPAAPTLTASAVEATTATLTIANHTGDWYHKYTSPDGGACSSAVSTTTANLTGLTAGTSYTYKAYSDSSCGTELATASAFLTKPAQVTGVTAAGNTQLAVSWTAVASATGYTVQWKSGNENYESGRQATATGASHTITGLTNGTQYTLRVKATNATGDGAWSADATGTPAAVTLTASAVEATTATLTIANHTGNWYHKYTVPDGGACSSAVSTTTANLTGLTQGTSYTYKAYSDSSCGTELATASAFLTKPARVTGVTAAGNTQLAVSWTAVTSATGYTVQWKSGIQEYDSSRQATPTGVSHTITGLTNGTQYTLRVKATNATGDGAWSADATATPGAVALTASAVEATTATLTLANHAGTWYHKYTTPSSGTCSSAVSTTTANLTGLTPGTSYTYKAYSDSTCGTELATATAFLTKPGQVTGVSVTGYHQRVEVNWTATTGATGYTVQWKSGNQSFGTDRQATTTNNYYSITGLISGTVYTVQVKATNGTGDGAWSNATTGTANTATLSASSVQTTAATLTLLNWPKDWYYKHTTPPNGTCSTTATMGVFANLTGLTAGTSYTYKAYSDSTCATEVTSATTDAEFLTKPAQVTGVAVSPGDASLGVSWTALSGTVTGYKVQWKSGQQNYNTGDRQNTVTSGTSSTITGLANATAYTVRVTAYNGTGDGTASTEGTGTPAAFCGRTPAVRDAIVALVPGKTVCSSITNTDLAALTGDMDLDSDNISSLKAGDFAGLSSLSRLDLGSNSLSSLPAGIFDPLTALTRLSLDTNNLTTLPAGVFDQLTSLQDLTLWNNNLTSLPSGVFDRLTKLRQLDLGQNSLSSLPAGIFDQLTSIPGPFYLDANTYTTLPSDIFENLTELTALLLSDTLTCLPFIPVSDEDGLVFSDGRSQAGYAACDAGATLSRTSLTAGVGGSKTYTVVLQAHPNRFAANSGNVTVTPASSATGKATVSPATLTFTTGNWSTPRTVTVSGVAAGSSTISHTISGGGYGSVSVDSVAATVTSGNLSTSAVTATTATLTIAGHTGNWYYKYTVPATPAGTCSTQQTGTTASLTGLTAGTSYTFKAYSDSTCATELANAASAEFLTRPAQVTGVSVTADNTQLAVSWTAVTSATGYTVQWKSGNENYESGRQATPTGTSHTITGLTNGTQYTLRVKATNGTGDGAWSADATGTPATAVTLTASAVEATTATLTIANHTGNWYYKYTTPSSGTCSSAVSTTTANLTGLTPGTSYTYKAYSNSTCGTELATASAFLTKPGQVTNVSAAAGNTQLAVSWTAVTSATGYTVQWKSGNENYESGRQATPTGTSHTITGLTNGTQYTLRVQATNGTGDGAWSADATGTPAAVTLTLAASAVKETTATLTISGHTAAWWYQGNQTNASCAAVAANTTTASLTGLTGGTDYTYKAYSNNTCTTELTTATTDADFSTVGLAATSVMQTGLTLNLSNWTAAWWFKKTAGTGGSLSCTGVLANTPTVTIGGLEAANDYTYAVYSASDCASANKIADVDFTTAVPTLAASNVKETTATLTISGITEAWWYKGDQNGAQCTAVAINTATASLTGLTGGTDYTYKAYSDNTCATELTDASSDAEFSTVGLAAGSITQAGATLTLSNWSAAWWHNKTAGPGSASCTSVAANTTTASLSSLTANSNYTWTVYSASDCASANKIADVDFTTAAAGPTLAASNVKETTATLTITGHTGAWYYQGNQSGAQCISVAANTTTASLSGLTGGTNYTYKAYSNNTCTTELTTASTDAEFSTVGLSAGSITQTGATLTLSNWTAAWWHDKTAGPGSASCTSVAANTTTASLTGLTANSNYTWAVYSASDCASANKIADVDFTTAAASTVPGKPQVIPFYNASSGSNGFYTYFLVKWAEPNPKWDEYWLKAGNLLGGHDYTGSEGRFLHDTYLRSGSGYNYSIQVCGKNDGANVCSSAYSASTTASGVRATVSASAITAAGATLTVSNLPAQWWYKGTQSGATCTPVANGTSSATLTGLDAETSYTYHVYYRASCTEDSDKADHWDVQTTFTTSAVLSVPKMAAPTLTGGTRQISMSWSHPDGVSGLQAYRIRYREKGETTWTYADAKADDGEQNFEVHLTSATIPAHETFTMEDNTTYEVQIRAGKWSEGYPGWGAWSDTAEATTLDPTLTASAVEATTATLTIANYSGTWYHKYTSPNGGTCSSAVSTTTANLTGLTPGTSYTYKAYSDSSCGTELATASAFLTKPAQVTGVTAATGNTQLAVSWTAVTSATGYTVQWKSGNENYGSGRQATPTGASHTITGLTNGTQYTLRVKATNGTGDGAWSADATGTPAAVTLTASAVEATTATLTIANHTGNWYHKYTSPNGGACSSAVSTTTANLTGLTAGTSYTYKAYSNSTCGTELATASAFLTKPARVTGVSAATGNTQLVVSWTAVSSATGYTVQWKSGNEEYGSGRQATPTGASHTITGLTNGTQYTLRVKATNATGDGAWSADATGTPAAVTLTASSVEATTATLTIANHTGNWYHKYTSPNGGACSSAVSTTTANLTGLTPGTSYTYKAYSTSTCGTELATASAFLTKPARVTGVTAAALSGKLAVSWTAVTSATGYTVQWKSGNENYGSGRQATPTGASHTITGLTNGTQYTLRVKATNGTGDGAWSADATGTPAAVTLTASAVEATTATLTIANHTGNWYHKYTSPNGGACSSAVSTTTANLTGLTPGTSYTYKAYSNSTCGTELATASAFLTKPARVTGVAAAALSGKLAVSWTAVTSATGYTVQWKSGNENYGSGRQATPTSASHTITGLTNGTQYTLRVKATNGTGDGAWSADATGTPAAVTLTASSVEATTATLTIANHTGTWYHKYTSPNGGTCSSAVSTTTANLTGLTPGTSYTYKAYSNSSCGTELATATAFLTKPAQVTGVSAATGNTQLAVSWTAVTSATGYTVQWKSGNQNYDSSRQATPTSASHTITGLTNGTQYTLRVKATNGTGDGAWSADATGTPAAVTLTASSVEATTATLTIANHTGTWYHKYTSPNGGTCSSAVSTTTANLTGLTPGTSYTYKAYSNSTCGTELATATAFLTKPAQVTGVSAATGNTQLAVSWTAVTSATGYTVQWKSGNQNYDSSRQATPTGASHTITGLTNGTQYTLRVKASNDTGDGAWSADATGTPAAVTLTASSVEATTATLTIANHTGNWYHKYTTPSSGTCSAAVTTTTANLTGLTPGASYTYKAYSDSSCGTEVATASAFLTKPAQVTGVTAVVSNTQLAVSWTAVTSATGYTVQWKSGNEEYGSGRQATATGTAHTVTGLSSGTAYTVRVRASNGTGAGAWSADATGTLPQTLEPLTFGSRTIANQTYIQHQGIAPLLLPAATSGTPPRTYTLTPALPAGLTFNPGTRVLSGTPTARQGATAYTYTATDSNNVMPTLTFTIRVEADVAPTFGARTIANQTYLQHQGIGALTLPAATGGNGPLRYSLSPALPAGLTFDPGTRTVAGTPTAPQAATRYTYTVTDRNGDAVSVTFVLVVELDVVPTFGDRTIADQTYVQRRAIAALMLPAAESGNPPLTYTLTPALPAGLTFDPGTRVLAGTPTAVQAATPYTYTVTDQDGDDVALTFMLTVQSAAEQAILTDVLAAKGRVLLSSATGVIGARFRTPGASSVAGMGLEACLGEADPGAAAPAAAADAAPAPECSTGVVDAVVQAVLALSGGVGGAPPADTLALADADETRPRGPRLGDMGAQPEWNWESLVWGRSFALPLKKPGAAGSAWTLWGAGDVQGFRGAPRQDQYDGQVRSLYLGVDAHWAEHWLAGAALAQSWGETDYVAGAGGRTGQLETTLTSLYPYVRGTLGAGLEVWAIGGYGRGEAKNTLAGDAGGAETSDLSMAMGATGARQPMTEWAGVELAVVGGAGYLSLATAGGNSLTADLDVAVQRARLAVEATGTAGGLAPYVQVGGRYDGGAGQTGAGLETVAGLRYTGERLEFEARGRWLAAHAAEGYEEYGGLARLAVKSRPDGTGLQMAVAPRWGAAEGAGLLGGGDALLDGGAMPGAGVGGMQPVDPGLTLTSELGYGFGVLDGHGVLTPYGGFAMTGNETRQYRVGGRLGVAQWLNLSLEGTRQEGTGQQPANQGVQLQLEGRF